MPSRTNFAVAFDRQPEPCLLASDVVILFGAKVKVWELIGQEHVSPLVAGELRNALDSGAIVLGVTDREPDVRLHICSVGIFDIVTVSLSQNAWNETANHDDLGSSLPPEARHAAFGDELEMYAGNDGELAFNGDRITVVSLAKASSR